MKIEEGYMPFKGYKTYYRIVGEKAPGKAPLLLIHGGPGRTGENESANPKESRLT